MERAGSNSASSETTMTRVLLACGVVAGPVYVGVGLIQMLVRDGFDIRRHALSLLSNGDLGWIQVANFLVTGLLVIVGAAGMRRGRKRATHTAVTTTTRKITATASSGRT